MLSEQPRQAGDEHLYHDLQVAPCERKLSVDVFEEGEENAAHAELRVVPDLHRNALSKLIQVLGRLDRSQHGARKRFQYVQTLFIKECKHPQSAMLDESEMADVADILRLMTHKNAPKASTIKAQIDRSTELINQTLCQQWSATLKFIFSKEMNPISRHILAGDYDYSAMVSEPLCGRTPPTQRTLSLFLDVAPTTLVQYTAATIKRHQQLNWRANLLDAETPV